MKAVQILYVAISLLAQPAWSSEVYVIDAEAGPGFDFTNFEQALPQVGPGDILLVRPGFYAGTVKFLTVPAEPLTIVGDRYPRIPNLRFGGLSTGEFNVLRGVRLAAGSVEGVQNEGVLWLEDSGFAPGDTLGISQAYSRFEGCSRVALERCRLRGRNAFFTPATPGIEAIGSELFVHDTRAIGGSELFFSTALPGGQGISLIDSFAFLSGTELIAGLSSTQLPKEEAIQSGSSKSVLVETTGEWFLQEGEQEELSGSARSFAASALNREGESVTFSFQAPAGELAVLGLANQPLGEFLPQFAGAGLLANPLQSLQIVGAVPASGQLDFPIPVPFLPAGLEGLTLFSQGAYIDMSSGEVRTGGGSAFVVLDDSF